jgi:cell division protein FtsL
MTPNTLIKQAIKDLLNPASILISLLLLLNLISSITVIFVKNQYRNMFIEMQQIKSQEQELNTQHSQLLLEQSTWQSQGRVENSAEKKHNMKEITPNDMKIIKIH